MLNAHPIESIHNPPFVDDASGQRDLTNHRVTRRRRSVGFVILEQRTDALVSTAMCVSGFRRELCATKGVLDASGSESWSSKPTRCS